ncbi:hypothetical protein CWI38_0823p0010, partial [Hamiltosporidium tvaerminnensis]
LYFLEYFRIKQNNKLRNVLKTILYSLAKSDDIKHFKVDKVSFHFSKQEYFSHELFKKISQEYFKILNFKTPSKLSLFIKEKEIYIPNQYKGLYTEDKKYILMINNVFYSFFKEYIAENQKKPNLFILLLNTLDIKYLHVHYVRKTNLKVCCFVLKNLKKPIQEILFYYSPIYDEIIKYLNINSIIRSLRKIVFINSFIETNLRFSYKLNKKIEFILYENSISSERYKVAEIENVENLNIIEEILNNLQYASRKSSIKDFDSSNTNISENKIKFYSKLFEVDTPTNKIKIFELLNLQNKNLEIKCFYDNYGNFLSILITLKELYLKQFAFKNTILEKNIKEIVIQNSNINCNFLTDILSINELESLKISYNNIYIEHDIIIRNRSIKYFGFKANNCDDIPHFYKLLGFLTGLKKYHSSLATDSKCNTYWLIPVFPPPTQQSHIHHQAKHAATFKIPSYDMTNPCILAIHEGIMQMALRTIFDSITADPRNGLEFFLQTKKGLNEWLHRYYDEKFGCTVPLKVLKKLAQSEMGSEVKLEENGERHKFLSKTIESSEKDMHSNELFDSKVLDLINRISHSNASYIIQAAHALCGKITRKEKPRSAWKKNIKSKISKLGLSKDLLEKAQFYLNLSSVTDLSKALVKNNESLNVYEKKITMHESRKQFRKENRRFYRGLYERVKSEYVSTMWNKNNDKVTYDDYSIPFVSNNHPTAFPSLDEFHYSRCGLAYLIPKGILQRGSDYRPITCMSNLYKLTTKCVTKVVHLEVERRGLLAENQLGTVRGVQGAKEQALLNIALNKDLTQKLDYTLRAVLCFYPPRIELGRVLHSFEFKNEKMYLQLLDCLIYISVKYQKYPPCTNKKFLKSKMRRNLEIVQLAKLYNEIEEQNFAQSYIMQKNELVSVSDSSRWLKKKGISGYDMRPCSSISSIEIIYEKRKNINCDKVGITSEIHSKYFNLKDLEKKNLLNTDLALSYRGSVEIISYGITWDGIVTKYDKGIHPVDRIKKSVEIISFDRRKRLELGPKAEESREKASIGVINSAEMHEEPTPLLKQDSNDKDGVKKIKTKDFLFQTEEHNKGTAININE